MGGSFNFYRLALHRAPHGRSRLTVHHDNLALAEKSIEVITDILALKLGKEVGHNVVDHSGSHTIAVMEKAENLVLDGSKIVRNIPKCERRRLRQVDMDLCTRMHTAGNEDKQEELDKDGDHAVARDQRVVDLLPELLRRHREEDHRSIHFDTNGMTPQFDQFFQTTR